MWQSWLIAHDSKSCIQETVSRVRTPSSPPEIHPPTVVGYLFDIPGYFHYGFIVVKRKVKQMIIHNDIQLDFDDVLIAPQTTTINHRGEVDIIRHFKSLNLRCVPIMSSNMTQTGTFDVAKELLKNKMCATLHKFYTANQTVDFINDIMTNPDNLAAIEDDGVDNCVALKRLFVTVGKRNWDQELKKLDEIATKTKAGFSVLLDVPNAYIPEITDCVKVLREKYPDKIIAVGNVCSGDETQKLILAGANLVKQGIGPSLICMTRNQTGCGRPQLSATIDCANAAHQVGGYVIVDGGFKQNGDFCKAFVAGGDFCMSGSMFVGCEESDSQKVAKYIQTDEIDVDTGKNIIEQKYFKEYYGMSSFRAQQENYGETTKTGTSEGVEKKYVPFTGPISDTINDICGALRSCGSYIGARNIKNFSRQGMFYKVNRIK